VADLRYRPGGASGFVSDDFCLVLEELADDQYELLWELATSRPDVVRLLDVLGACGIAAMPSFAAVIAADDQVRVVARGRLSIEVDSDGVVSKCDGAHVSTWSERAYPAAGVRGFRIRCGAPTDAPDLPLKAGVALVAEIGTAGFALTAVHPTAAAPAAEPRPRPDPPTALRGTPSLPEPSVHPQPSVQFEAEPESESELVLEPMVEDEQAAADEPGAQVEARAEDDAAATLLEPGEEAYDAMFGATIAGRTPEDAAVREFAEAPFVPQVAPPPGVVSSEVAAAVSRDAVPADALDHSTMTPEEFARLRARRAGQPTQQVVAPTAPAPSAPPPVLHFSTGREVVVDRPVFIGRAPRAASTSGGHAPTPVVLDDPYLSSTHLEVAVVGGVLLATDRSTNGTVLIAPGAQPVPLVKDLPTPVSTDSVLRITDQLTVRVAGA
jgi:hypothetical protein